MEDGAAIVQPRIHSAKKTSLESMIPVLTPISCHIDVSSLCNYRCSFCFQADIKGMKAVGLKRGFMELEMFKRIVDQLKDFPNKIKKLKIGNHGEPTMHPQLPEMIKYARESDTAEIIEMFTNGSKLTPEFNSALVESGLQRVNISLEGLSDERYLQVAGVKQDFSEIVAGVKDLYYKKEKAKSELIIYVKVADQTHALKGDIKEIFYLSKDEQAYFYDTFGSHCDEMFIEKIVPQWPETQQEHQNEVSRTGMYGQEIQAWKEVCPFVFMYLQFNCDGTVSPCTLDWPRKVVIGDVNKQSVKEIWEGQQLRELQLAMLMKKRNCINFCGSCAAPMVCVEENLDPHLAPVLTALDATESEMQLIDNPWVRQ
jgi:radical SAM protein with 4Fe4S-binding SPASM domain